MLSDKERKETLENDIASTHEVDHANDPDAILSEEERAVHERKLMRKLDLYLIPWVSIAQKGEIKIPTQEKESEANFFMQLCLLYLVCFLDRTNIGNAKIAHLIKDVPMTTTQFNSTLTIFFVSYAAFEVLANILLKSTRPSIFIPVIMIAWGCCMLGMGFVKNWSGLMAARWFLGVAEAGLFPGINYYLSCWYRRAELGARCAWFFSAAALAGSFGGLLAAAIQKMDGVSGIAGWAWIFILEGLLTILVGIASFWMVYDFPDEARFLTPDDRARVIIRLAKDQQASAQHEEFKMRYFWQAVTDWKTWIGMLIYMGPLMPLYSFSVFLPSIIQNMSFTTPDDIIKNQLLSVPPYALAAVVTVFVGIYSDKAGRRGIFNLLFAPIGMVGFIMLISSSKPGVQYAGTFLGALGIYPCIPITITWVANNVEGVYKRGIVLGMVIGWGNLNGIVSSNVFSKPPHFYAGHGTIIGYQFVGIFCGSLLMWVMLRRENKKRRAGERDVWVEGKSGAEIHELGDKRPDFLYTLYCLHPGDQREAIPDTAAANRDADAPDHGGAQGTERGFEKHQAAMGRALLVTRGTLLQHSSPRSGRGRRLGGGYAAARQTEALWKCKPQRVVMVVMMAAVTEVVVVPSKTSMDGSPSRACIPRQQRPRPRIPTFIKRDGQAIACFDIRALRDGNPQRFLRRTKNSHWTTGLHAAAALGALSRQRETRTTSLARPPPVLTLLSPFFAAYRAPSAAEFVFEGCRVFHVVILLLALVASRGHNTALLRWHAQSTPAYLLRCSQKSSRRPSPATAMVAESIVVAGRGEDLTPEQVGVLIILERTGGCISLVSVFLIFIAYAFAPRVRNVQNTFIVFASVSNVGASIACVIAMDGLQRGVGSPLCQAQSFLFEMFMQSDPWWSLAMAFNVFLVFFFRAKPDSFRKWWWLYCMICYGGPFVFALALLLVRDSEKGPVYGEATIWCWVDREWDEIRIYTYYMLIWICISGSLLFYFLVGYHVFHTRNQLKSFIASQNRDNSAVENGRDKQVETGRVKQVEEVHSKSTTNMPQHRRFNFPSVGQHGFYGTVTTEVQVIHSTASCAALPTEPKIAHMQSTPHVSFEESNPRIQPASSQYFSSVTSPKTAPVPQGSPLRRITSATTAVMYKFRIEDPIKRAYLRTSFLFALSVLVTWIPSSMNRIHSWLEGKSPYEFHVATAAVLPLQGLWNAVIFFVTSWRPLYERWRDCWLRMMKTQREEEVGERPAAPACSAGAARADSFLDEEDDDDSGTIGSDVELRRMAEAPGKRSRSL
ncbi:hypothetical protein G7046_g3806 [Stylonectria norvegica]|nr:hypothetical protein G7046_g3806 [Stylonectria norvegica]